MDYQKALRYAKLAQDIYKDFETIEFRDFPNSSPALFNARTTNTQSAIVPLGADSLALIFRGTENFDDWKTNVNFSRELFEIRKPPTAESNQPVSRQIMRPEQASPVDVNGEQLANKATSAKMHEGFVEAYMSIQNELHPYVEMTKPAKLTMTGHSLGGALATLCAIDFRLTYNDRFNIELFTYGSPRVGNHSFVELVNRHIPESVRFVNGLDIVPGVPGRINGYRHVDEVNRIGRRFTLRLFSARVRDHSMDNYISAIEDLL